MSNDHVSTFCFNCFVKHVLSVNNMETIYMQWSLHHAQARGQLFPYLFCVIYTSLFHLGVSPWNFVLFIRFCPVWESVIPWNVVCEGLKIFFGGSLFGLLPHGILRSSWQISFSLPIWVQHPDIVLHSLHAILCSVDGRDLIFLVLLDISAAFNTVDHNITERHCRFGLPVVPVVSFR